MTSVNTLIDLTHTIIDYIQNKNKNFSNLFFEKCVRYKALLLPLKLNSDARGFAIIPLPNM